MNKQGLTETNRLANFAKSRVWFFGIAIFLAGAIERIITFFSDRVLSVMDIIQLLAIVVFFLAWLSLKPEPNVGRNQDS